MATINFLDFIDGQLFRVIMDNHFNGLQVNVLTQQGRRTRYGRYGLRRTRFYDPTFLHKQKSLERYFIILFNSDNLLRSDCPPLDCLDHCLKRRRSQQ